jgi:putative membrane protein (TIGR04086 family)
MPFVLVIGFLFLLIGTLVAYRSADPHTLIPPLSLAALGLTSLMGGLISARRRRGNPLLSGLLCGLIMNLLLLGGALLFEGQGVSLGYSPLMQWGLHAAVAVLSLLGARMGMGRRR